MPVHFIPAEPTTRALRRVTRKLLGNARARLQKSRHPASIHGVRKVIKQLRAGVRLMRGTIGEDAYRPAAKALRRAAAELAATRDARVRLEALQLAGRGVARRFARLQAALHKNCRRESRRFRANHSAKQAERWLRETGRHLARLKFTGSGWAALEPGLKQSYLRGQQTGARARREAEAENFHDWRKQVKTLEHQLRLVCPVWPAARRKLMAQLEQLGQWLGEEHDLGLVLQFVAKHGHPAEAAVLNRRILAEQKKLRRAALKLGVKLYAPTPATVGRQLGKDWRACHGQGRKPQ
jgi:CHAD domain-containing protein